MENNKLFLAGVFDNKDDDLPLRIFLVNPTDKSFTVKQIQGSFDGSDCDSPILDLGYGEAGTFQLPPKSFHKVDQMNDCGELDFTTWYHFYCKPHNKKAMFKIWGQVNGMRVYWRQKTIIPMLKKKGFTEDLSKFK